MALSTPRGPETQGGVKASSHTHTRCGGSVPVLLDSGEQPALHVPVAETAQQSGQDGALRDPLTLDVRPGGQDAGGSRPQQASHSLQTQVRSDHARRPQTRRQSMYAGHAHRPHMHEDTPCADHACRHTRTETTHPYAPHTGGHVNQGSSCAPTKPCQCLLIPATVHMGPTHFHEDHGRQRSGRCLSRGGVGVTGMAFSTEKVL